MGSDESHFNVSVGSDGQTHKRMSTNHNLFEEKGEPKRYWTEVLPLTSLTPYRYAKPAHKSSTPSMTSFGILCANWERLAKDVCCSTFCHYGTFCRHNFLCLLGRERVKLVFVWVLFKHDVTRVVAVIDSWYGVLRFNLDRTFSALNADDLFTGW